MFDLFNASSINERIKSDSLAARTHVGLVRPHNEDDFLYISLPGDKATLVLVADGMGGHDGGELASFFTTQGLSKIWLNRKTDLEFKVRETEEMVIEGIKACNDHVYDINDALQVNRSMGTTVTAGLFTPGKVTLIQVGDSRCYLAREGMVKQLTEDQTWVAKMVKLGNLSEEEAENHPLSHLLSNCLGASAALQVTVTRHKRKAGDRYIFCTDGLYGEMSPNRLAEILLTGTTPKSILDDCITSALNGGGKDNITGIVVFDG